MMSDQARKWLRQQSKDFYASGFRRTGKAMEQLYQCWWRICREINFFFRFEYFCVLYPFVTYLLAVPSTTGFTVCPQETTQMVQIGDCVWVRPLLHITPPRYMKCDSARHCVRSGKCTQRYQSSLNTIF
jgi:hypothetical protein